MTTDHTEQRRDAHGEAAAPPVEATPRLALRPKDAAAALGIGARLLWSMTNRHEIPHVRMGRAILYPVDALRNWLAENVAARPQRR